MGEQNRQCGVGGEELRWGEWSWGSGLGHAGGCPWGWAPSLMTPSPPAPPALPTSDYIIKEKTVLLQKKDSEGFGFVLRGAKGECLPAWRG